MINGKRKAITFSYDDGVFQDKRLLKIFNEYGLKGTFNLNSNLFENRHPTIYNHICVTEKEASEIYRGHELAVHTLTHPVLTEIAKEEIIRQVEDDKKNLERICGESVVGMAYPCGPYNDFVKNVLAENTKMQYARTAKSTHSFVRQTEDLLALHLDITLSHITVSYSLICLIPSGLRRGAGARAVSNSGRSVLHRPTWEALCPRPELTDNTHAGPASALMMPGWISSSGL